MHALHGGPHLGIAGTAAKEKFGCCRAVRAAQGSLQGRTWHDRVHVEGCQPGRCCWSPDARYDIVCRRQVTSQATLCSSHLSAAAQQELAEHEMVWCSHHTCLVGCARLMAQCSSEDKQVSAHRALRSHPGTGREARGRARHPPAVPCTRSVPGHPCRQLPGCAPQGGRPASRSALHARCAPPPALCADQTTLLWYSENSSHVSCGC